MYAPFERLLSEPVRNGIYKSKDFHGRGAKIVNMGELFAHPRLRPVAMKRVELTPAEQGRFALNAGDLLFARRSLVAEGAGKCSIVLDVDTPTVFESSIIRARPDPAQADPEYLYYFFNSPPGLHRLDTIRRHAAVAGITGTDLSKLEIPFPPLPEQHAIAHILGALDDSIEVNLRLNETREEIAQALFRSWFADFDPAPDGWSTGRLGDLVERRVERCDASEQTAAQPYVPIDCIAPKSLTLMASKPGSEARSSLTRFYRRDILFGAVRPYFHKVCIAPFDGTTRTTVFVLTPRRDEDFSFAALLLRRPSTIDYATRHSTGTTIPYAAWARSLAEMEVVIPPPALRAAFDRRVRAILERSLTPYFENRALASMRDTLMAGLMSGEIQVKDADRFLGSAGDSHASRASAATWLGRS